MGEQKQFEASAKKKKKARDEGQIPRSRELTQALQLSSCYLLLFLAHYWGHSILDLYHKIIQDVDSFSAENIQVCSTEAGAVLLGIILLWFGVLCIVSLASEMFQLGEFRFSMKLLAPKLDRLDPVKGFRRILGERDGMKPGVGLFAEAVQITCIGGVALMVLWFRVITEAHEFFELETETAQEGIVFIREKVSGLLRDIVIVSLVFGIIKYFMSCKRIRKKLMMDFEELKREVKEDEGDPHVKGQRKSMHQEVLLHGMIENVKKAKVVIVSND
jgi:flagellar biosynthesis protein FlhB